MEKDEYLHLRHISFQNLSEHKEERLFQSGFYPHFLRDRIAVCSVKNNFSSLNILSYGITFCRILENQDG